MARYTQGIMADGACILRDGVPVTIDSLIGILNRHDIDTATPPADAALADELDCVASELATYQSDNAATVSRAAAALRARAVPEGDVIEKIEEYGGHRENEGGSYATFQKSEARRYRAEADEVLGEIRAMLAASKAGDGKGGE